MNPRRPRTLSNSISLYRRRKNHRRGHGLRTPTVERLEERMVLASLTGVSFDDVNDNGVYDAGDAALSGITVYLDQNNNRVLDGGEASTTTGGNGQYEFLGLSAGEYVVRQIGPPETVQTAPRFDDSYYAYTYVVGSGGQMQPSLIEPQSGDVRRLGTPGLARLHGLTRTNDGAFYGMNGFDPDRFFSLDITTNQRTEIGQIGSNTAFGLAYDPSTDTIYGLVRDTGDGLLKLATFDRTTGQATLIGPGTNELANTSGLAFDTDRGVLVAFDNNDDQFWQFDTAGTPTLLWDTSGLNGWGFTYNGDEFLLQAVGQDNGDPSLLNRLFYRLDPYAQTIQQDFFVASEAVPLEALDYYRVEEAHLVYVDAGEDRTGLDIGTTAAVGDIHGLKFDDANGNGVRDQGEGTLEGVTIYLDLNDNGVLDQAGDGGVEPDDFADGTVLTSVSPGVTLRVIGPDGTSIVGDVVFASGGSNSLFAHDDPGVLEGEEMALWAADYRSLRMDFNGTVEFISLDYIGRGLGDVGRLQTFDTDGNLLGTYLTGNLGSGQRETMTLSGGGIAYAVATAVGQGPTAQQFGFLDSLSFSGTVEPSTLTDAGGQYWFLDVPIGDQVIREVVPEGYLQTFPLAGPARLFATTLAGSGNEVREIDPQTGDLVNFFPIAGFDSFNTNGLAFDGRVLYALSSSGTLFEVDPDDGTVLDTMQLPSGRWDGLAALNGLVYANDPTSNTIQIIDPTTNSIVGEIDFGGGSNIRPFGALGEFTAADGTASLLGSVGSSSGINLLDPRTGAVTGTIFHGAIGGAVVGDLGLAGLGGEIYVGFDDSAGTIQVFTTDNTLQRTLQIGRRITALGGAAASDSAHRVELHAGEILTGLDFGNQLAVGEIRGTKFEDVNGNGFQDQDEGPLSGVTIYLDLNDNGVFDFGDLSTQTGPDGSYAFTEVSVGDYVVRELVPAGFQQTAPVNGSRLFATLVGANPDLILEIDPQTGATLNVLPTPGDPNTALHGIAFDGTTLYYMNAITDTLYELDPNDGTVRDSTQFVDRAFDGLAEIDGLIYLMETQFDDIHVFDPVTNTTVRVLDLNAVNPGVSFLGGLGESGDRKQLVATTSTDDVVFINPANGLITGSFNHGGGPDFAATGFNGQIYVGFSSPDNLRVYDDNGTLLRTFGSTFQIFGLAGFGGDGSHRVTVRPNQILAGLDFGNQSLFGDLRGTKFEDVNGNGLRDQGEGPLEGVTIFLDRNNDGVLNAGEPFTQTGVNGDYAFAGLPIGDYTVREVVPAGFQQTAPAIIASRLFATNIFDNPNTIVEIDHLTGATVNTIPAPVDENTGGQGLAFDGTTLYYVDATSDTLFELDPDDGTILDSMVLPSGGYDGIAVLGGLVYILDTGKDDILVVDAATNSIVRTHDVNGVNPGFNLLGGLGESGDGRRLVAPTTTSEVLYINPRNGVVTGRFDHGSGAFDGGVAGFNGETYLGFNDPTGTVQVFDDQGVPRRSFGLPFGVFGLAGGGRDGAYRVSLGASETIDELDFGNIRANQPPVADAGGPYAVDEGGAVMLDGTGSSDPDGDALIYTWDLDGDGLFGETGAGAERGDETGAKPVFSAAGLDGLSTFTVELRVEDPLGAADADAATVTVLNVAPVIDSISSTARMDQKGTTEDPVTIFGTFRDAGVPDTHTAEVDWGDGKTSPATIDQAMGTLTADHLYETGGIFEITITLSDDDGGTAVAHTSAVVTGVGVVGDVLYVIGTSDDDHVSINQQGKKQIKVHADFLVTGSFVTVPAAGVNKIIAYLCEGDDHLTIAGNIDIPAIIHGGGGNDHLSAGGGQAVLLGDAGDDLLVGGSAGAVMIGGLGADRLIGGRKDDVLIGGTTTDDDDDDALMTLLAAWNSDDDYDARVLAVDQLLTVEDDRETDILTGSSGRDLFYDGFGDFLTDVKRKKDAETVK